MDMPLQVVQHKRGDTFIPTCTYLDKTGAPAAYATLGITVKSQVRDRNGLLVAELTVTAGTGVGEFVLASGNTQNWPLGSLRWDIQFTQGGNVFSTDSAALEVSEDVTH